MKTVKELIEDLKTMPQDAPVYINQESSGACVMAQSVAYSDTLSNEEEDDSAMTDGVIISSFNDEG